MAVTLVERYNPDWPHWFAGLKARLETKLAGHILAIEHVGSTSVPGMTAKPVIDLDIVIRVGEFERVKSLLVELGYFHEGNLGIPDRDAFDIESEESKKGLPRHHPYVCPETSAELKRHLAFRDFLRGNPQYVRRLSQLKWQLAMEHDNDREAYMTGKEVLCREIREKARKAV